jgi:hypothetical protein
VNGDFRRAADLYNEIGSRPDEAYARLRAGEALLVGDRPLEAKAEFEQALAFYRHVGATAYMEEADALTPAKAGTGQ